VNTQRLPGAYGSSVRQFPIHSRIVLMFFESSLLWLRLDTGNGDVQNEEKMEVIIQLLFCIFVSPDIFRVQRALSPTKITSK